MFSPGLPNNAVLMVQSDCNILPLSTIIANIMKQFFFLQRYTCLKRMK